jgi:TonB family protein
LTLSPDGKVVRVKILESSGSAMLDETLKKAIYAAAPFKVPSQQFELFRTNKISFYPLQ